MLLVPSVIGHEGVLAESGVLCVGDDRIEFQVRRRQA